MKGFVWLCTHYKDQSADEALRDEPLVETGEKHFTRDSLPTCAGSHKRERLPIDSDLICFPEMRGY